MANKLAGQRAKFSRARAIYFGSGDDGQRQRAAELMAEVLLQAAGNGFMEEEVTQGEDVPDEVRRLLTTRTTEPELAEESDEELVLDLQQTVDARDVAEIGSGAEYVYAYGYRCAPDRLKIGSCAGDVVARIAAQISTGTPDKPWLCLVIRTHDCRALERAIQNILRLRGRKVEGAGAEWFVTSPDDILVIYKSIVGEMI